MKHTYIRNSLRLLYGVLLLVIIYSCANQGTPNGGPYDEEPPKFISSTPLPNQTNYKGQKIEMSVSSLRVDAITPDIVQTLVAAGQKNSTLAIEAGSERLRKVINKNITEEQIFNAVKICRENGLKGLKFYGMLGLPTESQKDLEELISLAKRLKTEFKGFDISFGFSSFVPKPHTPFQWCGREETKYLESKANFIKKELHKLGVSASVSSIKWDYWQAVLSRGDETFAEFLIDVYKKGGKIGAFKSAAKVHNINTDYYAYTNFDLNTQLPWDFIEINPGTEFIKQEHLRLLKQEHNRNI